MHWVQPLKNNCGTFKKNLLMQAVATGVALGIATELQKSHLTWNLFINSTYTMLLILTFISCEDLSILVGYTCYNGLITVPLFWQWVSIGAKLVPLMVLGSCRLLCWINYHCINRWFSSEKKLRELKN